MTPLKFSDLPNHSWKPCKRCNYGQLFVNCNNCQGHGVEPVAVENPMKLCFFCHHYHQKRRYCGYNTPTTNVGEYEDFCECKESEERLHQVGVPFCECGKIGTHFCPIQKINKNPKKFLPISPKVKGDLSVLMVVKVN